MRTFLAGGDRGARSGRRGTLGVSMKQAIGALILVVLVLVIVLRQLGLL